MDAKISNIVLVVYVAAFVIIVPIIVMRITKKWKKTGNDIKVDQETIGMFNQIMYPNMEIKNVIEVIAGAGNFTFTPYFLFSIF